MKEVWKDIQGYEGKYQISNFGNVKSLRYAGRDYSKNLVPKVNNDGRLWVELFMNGCGKPFLIHRLVAREFIPNPNNYPQINHKDENPKNNYVENLEWCTGSYNIQYYMNRHPGVYKGIKTNERRKSKHSEKKVNQMDKEGCLVRQWENPRTIKVELGMNEWSIIQCCNGKRKTAYGFRWQYAI